MTVTPRTVSVIGVPMDLGQSRRGVDMGPSAVRYAGLEERILGLGHTFIDRGNVSVPERSTLPPEGGMNYLPAVVETCTGIYEAGRTACERGRLPLFLGGDHSIAIGTVGGASHADPTGVVWVDAHADLNTPETTPSGNIHGMPLAALIGRGAPELLEVGRSGPKIDHRDLALIGLRDLDPGEQDLIRQLGIAAYTMREIDQRGIAAVAEEALTRLSHCQRLHISLDMDSIDPSAAPGVGTPVPGGLTYREAHLLMESLADANKVTSIDVVEVNPILDQENRTALLAVELLSSLLGKRIV